MATKVIFSQKIHWKNYLKVGGSFLFWFCRNFSIRTSRNLSIEKSALFLIHSFSWHYSSFFLSRIEFKFTNIWVYWILIFVSSFLFFSGKKKFVQGWLCSEFSDGSHIKVSKGYLYGCCFFSFFQKLRSFRLISGVETDLIFRFYLGSSYAM